MVQYKRKPVKLVPEPPFLDDHTEVWYIPETQEVFVDYEKYLHRRDFYQQKKFTCNATGHSGLTFFEALESEMDTVKEIDSFFPEALRGRLLHYAQFQRTPRMDDLVNAVFERFKEDYIVGDRVVVEEHGSRLHGYIRDITDPNPKNKFLTDGSLADTSKPILYYISLDTGSDEITKLGCKEFSRDRKFYSKLVLKSFLRNAVSRENWTGAPWLVKEKLAAQYNISTQVPEAKTRDAIMAAKKAVNAANAAAASMPPPQHQPQPAEHGVTFFSYLAAQNQAQNPNQQAWPMDSNRPMPKPQKQTSIADFTRQQQPQQPFQLPPHLNGRITQYMPLPGQNGVSPPFHHMQPGNPLPINLPFQNQFMQYQVIAPTAPPPHHQAPPAPPPIKYPIEDLDIVLRPNAPERPALKFFSDDIPAGCDPPEQKTGILMKSMGALLCIWETLNVHETVFHLDSFTFDDFVEAMLYKSDGEDCELFTEAHCAVLSQLIAENGRVLVALPKVEDSEDGSGDGETSTLTSPEPEVEEAPPARNTRSSLAKSEAAALAKRSPTPVETKLVHKAAEFLTEYDWINRCASRDYVSGGWQSMMVGLIYNVSFIPGQKEICEDILAKLVPVDDEPMVESVKANYDQLDVNLRAAALEIACMLSVRTEIFRSELSKAGEEMTKIRKQKIEHQREKKVLVDELLALDQRRKIQLPANLPASPGLEVNGSPDVTMTGTEDAQETAEVESTSDDEPRRRSRKTRHTKSLKRKREDEEARKEKAKKDKIEAAKNKQAAEWRELLEQIDAKKQQIKECEDAIEEQDNDLRETMVQRSKWLGKDRFMNRYYWFERNGMPYGGLPESSTSSYGYANGRVWVQGPDKTEMDPLTQEPMVSKDKEILGISVPERRVREEGRTILHNSNQWGYYDDPEAVDKLLEWLDERGAREKGLRKELQIFRDPIVEHMVKMKDSLTQAQADDTKSESDDSPKRSTRTRRTSETNSGKPRCFEWTNNIMRNEFGYSHSEQGKPKKAKKGVARPKVPQGRSAKPATRQGTRYGK